MLGLLAMIPMGWNLGEVVLSPGPRGGFDETAVKDPSVVRYKGNWHVFYTARGGGRYTTGYVAAKRWEELARAPRYFLPMIRGRSPYGCAPQVFYFEPKGIWVMLFQTDDSNYQPAYSMTRTLDDPLSWSAPKPLVEKDENDKWIDFWTICDRDHAYLFYTRDHKDVMVRRTRIADFPAGWGPATVAFSGVHEAVHVYKARGADQYDMIYEANDGERSFGLAQAPSLSGPWRLVDPNYATSASLYPRKAGRWTDEVSHGEILRHGYDQRLEYDAAKPTWLIQGVPKEDYKEPYPEIPWRLGLMSAR